MEICIALLEEEIHNDYVGGIIDRWDLESNDIEDYSLKWELFKMDIRTASIAYSKTQAKLRRGYEKELSKQHEEVSINVDDDPSNEHLHLSRIRVEIERLSAIKTDVFLIRSRALEIEEGEKCTNFVLSLEKRKARLMNITKLKLDDSKEITDQKSILKEQHKFYKNLYIKG